MRPMSLFPWLLPALPTAREIAEETARRRGLTLEQITARTRRRDVLWPRQEAIAAVMATGRYSAASVGRLFGVHRTVVTHSVEQWRKRA